MKKKIIAASASAAVIVIAIVLCIVFVGSTKLSVSSFQDGKTVFQGNTSELSSEDLAKIKDCFDNKTLYRDNPSCGFSDQVSVTLLDDSNAYTFCFAMDSDNIVYLKEKNMYFQVSDSEKELIYTILSKYGFTFPCV